MRFRGLAVAVASLGLMMVMMPARDARAVGTRTFELDSLEKLSGGDLKGASVGSDGVVRAGWTLGNVPLPEGSGTTATCAVALPDGSRPGRHRALRRGKGRPHPGRPRLGLRRHEGKRGQRARGRQGRHRVRGDDEQQDLPRLPGQGRRVRDARRRRQRAVALAADTDRGALRRHGLRRQGHARRAGRRLEPLLQGGRPFVVSLALARRRRALRRHEQQGSALPHRRRRPRHGPLRLPGRGRARHRRRARQDRVGHRQRGRRRSSSETSETSSSQAHRPAGARLPRPRSSPHTSRARAPSGASTRRAVPRAHAPRRVPLPVARARRDGVSVRGHRRRGARLHRRRRAPGVARGRHRRAADRRRWS